MHSRAFRRAGTRIENSEDLSTPYQAGYIRIHWETRATWVPRYELCRIRAAINGQFHCVLGRCQQNGTYCLGSVDHLVLDTV